MAFPSRGQACIIELHAQGPRPSLLRCGRSSGFMTICWDCCSGGWDSPQHTLAALIVYKPLDGSAEFAICCRRCPWRIRKAWYQWQQPAWLFELRYTSGINKRSCSPLAKTIISHPWFYINVQNTLLTDAELRYPFNPLSRIIILRRTNLTKTTATSANETIHETSALHATRLSTCLRFEEAPARRWPKRRMQRYKVVPVQRVNRYSTLCTDVRSTNSHNWLKFACSRSCHHHVR